jgi:hypothetical protein
MTRRVIKRIFIMDIGILTQTLITYLLPALPFLTSLGTKAAEKAAEEIGADVWETAQGVWEKISPSIDEKPAAAEAVNDAVNNADDEDAVAALRHQLKKILTENQGLAGELSSLLADSPQSSGNVVNVSGSRNVTSGGNMTGNTINTGDNIPPKTAND